MDIERDLLFGLFAVREGYLSLEDYSLACRELAQSPGESIAELLVRKGLIDARTREVLDEGVAHGISSVRTSAIRPARSQRATTVKDTFGIPNPRMPLTEAESTMAPGQKSNVTLELPNAVPPAPPRDSDATLQVDQPTSDSPPKTMVDPNATLQSNRPKLAETIHDEKSRTSTPLAETLSIGDSAASAGGMSAAGQPSPNLPRVDPRNPARYTFIKVIGEGGLGRVWMARDNDLNREVALKEIQPRIARSESKSRRFVLEAEVTGQLEHPNIVPVYELAHRAEDGQPFYTMRFVRGKTLSNAIADYHQARKEHRAERLEFARLLGRFYGVCYALGYAHSRGVIHRDLKPENVVLGDYGEVYLIDWGLAKLVEIHKDSTEACIRLSETAAQCDAGRGGLEGTPAYMAPEQVDAKFGSLGTHSDIYGLGAILFEILTGQSPHRGESLTELLDEIVNKESPLVRQLAPSVPAALEAICAKAMSKQPELRYLKAGDLALDVQRYMNDEPVSAYREPPLERLSRWARRHKTWTQAAAAALVIVTCVSIVASIMIKGAQSAEAIARKEAEGRYEQARSFADTLLAGVSNDLKDVPGAEGIQRRILDKASAAYQGFAAERSSDPALVLKSGQAHLQLAEVHNLLDETVAAVESCKAAETVFESLAKNYPLSLTPAIWRAYSLAMQGRVLNHAGKNEDALTPYREAMAHFDEMIKQHPHNPELLDRKGEAEIGYAMVLQELNKLDEAEKTYKDALKDYDHLVSDAEETNSKSPTAATKAAVRTYRANRARGLNNLATLIEVLVTRLTEQNKVDEAASKRLEYEKTCRAAIADLEVLVSEAADVPEYLYQLSASVNSLGNSLSAREMAKEAEKEYGRSVERYETLVYLKTVPKHMNGLVQARINLARSLAESDMDFAEAMLRAAIYDAKVLARVHPNDPTYQDVAILGSYHIADL